MNEQDLRRELDETYRQFDAADQAGDSAVAKDLQTYGLELEGRINSLRRTTNRGALAGTETNPDLADTPEVQQQKLDEARPALEELDQASKEIDKTTGMKASDYTKSAYGDALRVGAGAFEEWATSARLHQQDTLEELEFLQGEDADPAVMDKLKARVAAGEEINDTFYGTFVQPFFTKDGVPPEQRLRKAQESMLKSRTPSAQAKAEKPFFQDNPEALRKFNMADPATWFDDTAMPWEDPEAFMLALSQNSVSLSASMISAFFGGRAGAMMKGSRLRAAGITNPKVVREISAKTGAATGTLAGSATEYVMVRDATQMGLQDALKEHWDKDELWAENPRYTELTEDGYSPEYAKQVVTDEIARTGGTVAGVSSALLGAPMNRFWAKIGLEKAANRVSSTVKGAVGESLQEGVQETVETLTANIAESTLDPSKPWTADLANAFFGGAAMGGAMGGAMGVLSGGDSQVALNKDQKQLNKLGFKEWRDTQNERSSLQSKLRDPAYMQDTSPNQRIKDFNELEELEYREAKAYKRSEKKIRQMQKKYGIKANEKRRTEIFSERYGQSIENIELARKSRIGAEEQVESTRQQMAERDEIIRQVNEDNMELADLESTKVDLETLAEGGVIEDTQSLIEQGYARWTSKAQTKMVLTSAGRNARRSIGEAVERLHSKIDSGFAGEERRETEGADADRRKRIEEMTPEEKDAELKTHEKTNIPNLRAFEEDERAGSAGGYASVDADSLGWVNDNMGGHPKGDELLRKIARAGMTEGIDFYHVTGDEFIARGKSEEAVEEGLKRVAARLAGYEPVADEAGRTVQPAITWTTGDTYENADSKLNDMKAQRAFEGKRAPKKDAPPPSFYDPAAPTQFGLFSYNGPVSAVQDIVNQIKEVQGNTDEFSRRRLRKLSKQMSDLHERTASMEVARAVEGLMEELDTPSDAQLARDWSTLDQTSQQRYDLAASEFYTPYAGELVTGLEVYQHEHGSPTLKSKLPSAENNDAGERTIYENSQEFAQLREFVSQNRMPQTLRKSLQKDAVRLGELMQNEDDALAYALSLRVAGYLGGEYAARGPNPFSANAADFDVIHDDYNSSVLPLLMWAGDPVMTQGFYRPLAKGDRVEVIVNGEGVEGIVSSTGNDSMVVRWDSKGPQLYNPDSGATGNSARFSTKYGWQSSAKAARAGTSYKSQGLSWPGQARLGRRFNKQTSKWEDAKQNDKARRQIRKRVGANAPRSMAISRASRNKATTSQLNSARHIANQLLAGYNNLPTINIASTVADLPSHMQDKLVAHGYSGEGVMGMFDELEPKNGVWVLAGNVAAKAKAEKVSFETLFAETIAHETIGHYGLRGFMGSELKMDRWMDALARSNKSIGKEGDKYTGQGTVRDAVMQTGIQRGLVVFNAQGKPQYRSEEARRLAAEETIAEIAQRIIQQTPGYQLSEQQRGILKRIADHIRVWLIDHGFGRYVRLGDQDIYRMIWQSQNFASNGKGWEYRAKTGRNLTPYMRDADIFRAAVLTHFYDGMRPTNGQERRDMKAQDLPQLKEVPFYPKQASRAQWKQLFTKAVSDKHVKAAEYAMTQMEDYLDDITYSRMFVDAGIDSLPEEMIPRVRELEAIVNFDHAKAADRMEAMRQQAMKAHELRDSIGSIMGQDFDVIGADYIEQRAKVNLKSPTVEETETAQAELNEMLKQKPGKKAKIPRAVIAKQLERKALKITVRPAGGYNSGEEGLTDEQQDIHPGNWQEMRPRHTGSYDSFVPVGTDQDQFGVYVFFQQNPKYESQIEHTGFSMDNGYGGSFMHLRYAMGVTADGRITYNIIEVQSDNFQKKDKAATSVEEHQMLSDQREAANRVMDTATQKMGQNIGAAVKFRVQLAFENMIENDEYYRDGRTDPSDRFVYDHLNETYNPIRISIGNFRVEIQRKIKAMGALTADDARVVEYLDLKALDGAADVVLTKINRLEETTYNPRSEDSYDTDRWIKNVDKFDMEANDTLERVVARPQLLETFLNGVMTPITGKDYDAEDVKTMQMKTLQGSSQKETVTFDTEFLAELKDRYGSYMLTDALDEFTDGLKALGWTRSQISHEHTDSGQRFSAWANREDGTPLALVMKAALHKYIGKRSTTDWDARERTRIATVKGQIRNIEQTGGEISSQEDLDRAKSEIEYGEDHGIDPDIRHIDRDTYADQKTDGEIENARANGTLRDLADEYGIDYGDFEYDGEPLTRDHSDYRSRISVDDDGDADTTDAEEWLADRLNDEMDDLFDQSERGWQRVNEYHLGQFDGQYEDTSVQEFAVPIEWDEDGDVIDTEKGYIVANQEDDDGDVDSTHEIHWDNDTDYGNYNEDDALSTLNEKIFQYYDDNNIKPPEDSVFHIRTSQEVPQELRDQLQPLPRESSSSSESEFLRKVQQAELETDTQKTKTIALTKAFDDRIMIGRVIDAGVIEATPLRDVWQSVGLTFAIADAVRKGAESITWQGAEALESRGASTPEWQQAPHVDWVRKTMIMGGAEKEVFVISVPGEPDLVLDSNRMTVVLGARVAKEITRQANDPDPELPAKRARKRYTIVPLGERFALFDNIEEEVLGFRDTALTAETMRVETIQRALTLGSNELSRPSGRITGNDMGGHINILQQNRLPDYYVHTVLPGQKLRGARTAYDVMIPSQIRKLVKPYGGQVTEGIQKIPKESIARAISKDGAHASYKVSEEFQAKYPNLQVEAFGGHGYVVLSDNGLAVDEIYNTQQEATDKVESLLQDAQAEVEGIFVYEIKITDAMRLAYGGGSLPIMSKYREHYTEYNAHKDPSGWTMPERLEYTKKKRASITAGLAGEINQLVRETGVKFSELGRKTAAMHEELGLPLSTKDATGITAKLRDITMGHRTNITPTELVALDEVISRLSPRGQLPLLSIGRPQGPVGDVDSDKYYTKDEVGKNLTNFFKAHPDMTFDDLQEAMENGPDAKVVAVGTMRDMMHTAREIKRINTDPSDTRKTTNKYDPKLSGYVREDTRRAIRAAMLSLSPRWRGVMPAYLKGVGQGFAGEERIKRPNWQPGKSAPLPGEQPLNLKGTPRKRTGLKNMGVLPTDQFYAGMKAFIDSHDITPAQYAEQTGSNTSWVRTVYANNYHLAANVSKRVVDREAANMLKINPNWKDPWGAGRAAQLPLFSRDPISGNPILEAMAKKVGQVPLQKTMAQRFDHMRKGLRARLNQGIFDKFYGIQNAMNETHWEGSAEQNPYMSARLTTSLDSQMRAVMSYGHPVWDDGIMKVEGKGLLEILGQVGKPEDLRAWSLYMVAKRSAYLREDNREQLITDEEIAEGLALGERFPVFKKVAEEYAEFNKAVLDFAEASGVIDPDTRPLWEHADYVPFYRVMDERVVGPLSTTTGIANQRKPIKQLKGGEAALADIPTNIIQNVTNLIESSNKNAAALLAVNALNNTGVMSKIPSLKAEQALVPMAQVKQALVTAGLDPELIPPKALKGMQKMFIMKPPSGEGVITVLRDGKNEYYQTDDRVLWEAMTMINQKQFGRWMNLFRGPKRFLTMTVTLDPGFMLANYVRDLASSFVQSRDTNNPLTHMARSVQGWKQAVMKDESIKTMMSAGAAFDSGYMNYGDPNSTSRAIRKAQRSQGFRQSLLDTPAKVFDYYKEFGASFENANRIAVYNEALANGKSVKQASFEAKDLMDFSMGGSYPVVQFLIQSVPFMGARLQGLHRLGRGFADNPVAFAMKGLMLSMAGMALWFNYKDDERYKQLEEWDKDTYYHWWIGDKHMRLPKPFEVGVVFNTWLERAFEYAYSESPDAEKLLLNRFMFSLGETFAFNPIPQVVKPAVESAFNYNFFTGRQIVDPYTEKRLPPEQFRPSTSPSMVEIARQLPSGLDKASKTFRSPQHLENLYRGYFGTLGRYAMMASDEMVRQGMDYPSKPSMQPADYPISGRFYRGTDDMPRRTKYEEEFYDLFRKTEEVSGSLRFLDKIGNANRMAFIEAEQEPIIALTKDVDKTRKKITDLNRDTFDVWMDETITPDEKRVLVDEIQEAKNEEYKAIHDLKEEVMSESRRATPEDITYMLEQYGVDEVASRIEETQPATASLIRDVQGLELGALSR